MSTSAQPQAKQASPGAIRPRVSFHAFGASAPLKELRKKFGFTPDVVAAAAKEELAKGNKTQ